jgi:hypothetical protein
MKKLLLIASLALAACPSSIEQVPCAKNEDCPLTYSCKAGLCGKADVGTGGGTAGGNATIGGGTSATGGGGIAIDGGAGTGGGTPTGGGMGIGGGMTIDSGVDAGPVDSGIDAGALDAGALDAGAFDAGAFDAGAFDAGAFDAGAFDAGAFDAGAFDAGAFDAGAFDAGAFDAGAFDAGAFDAGAFDAGPPCGANVMRDDFRNSGIVPDVTKWSVDVSAPDSGAGIVGGRLQLINRAHVSSVRAFVPSAAAPLRVTGEYTFGAANDALEIVTRSNGGVQDGGGFGSTGGTACAAVTTPFAGMINGVSYSNLLGGIAVRPSTTLLGNAATGSAIFSASDTIVFDVFDDGASLSCSFRKKGGGPSFSVSAPTTFVSTSNLVTIFNRDLTGPLDVVSYVDNVSIEQGVTVRPTHQWNFDDVTLRSMRDGGLNEGTIFPMGIDGGLTGTLQGQSMISSQGLLGDSLSLNGVFPSAASMGDTVAKFGNDSFSISYWFKTSAPDPLMELVGNRLNSSTNYVGTRLARPLQDGGVGSGVIAELLAGASTVAPVAQTINLHDGQWHHVAVTRSGTRASVWVDGRLADSKTATILGDYAGSGNFYVGRKEDTSNVFKGEFDDVRIYRGRALNSCEVQAVATPPLRPSVAPTLLTILPSTSPKNVHFVWNGASGPVTFYMVERSLSAGLFGQFGFNTPGLANELDVEIPVHLTTWDSSSQLRVRACNEYGCGPPSAQIPFTQPDSNLPIGYFKADNSAAGEKFGSATALSADGNTMVVGAPFRGTDGGVSPGAAYVFTKNSAGWAQQAILTPSDNPTENKEFGFSVAISADGNTVAVGAPKRAKGTILGAGAGYIFGRIGSVWMLHGDPIVDLSYATTNGKFGYSIALSGDGNTVVFGSPASDYNLPNSSSNIGIVQTNKRPLLGAGLWPYITVTHPGIQNQAFGCSVSLSFDGLTMAVGACGDDFTSPGIILNNTQVRTGTSTNSGSAYVYKFNAPFALWGFDSGGAPDVWFKPNLVAAGDLFGSWVSLSADANTLAVGAPGQSATQGAAYVYQKTNVWTEVLIKASNPGSGDEFGATAALTADGLTLAVSAPNEDGNTPGVNGAINESGMNTGAVYVFKPGSNGWSNWQQQSYVKAPNPGDNDLFGAFSVSLSADGKTMAVGAPQEDSNENSVRTMTGNSLPNDSATNAGAVYLY